MSEAAEKIVVFDELEAEAMGAEAVNDPVFNEPEPTETTAELLQPVLGVAFGVLAPNWNIQAVEVEQLAGAYGGLIDKYYPEGIGQFGVELNAVILTGAIFLPRIGQPRSVAANDETFEQKKEIPAKKPIKPDASESGVNQL